MHDYEYWVRDGITLINHDLIQTRFLLLDVPCKLLSSLPCHTSEVCQATHDLQQLLVASYLVFVHHQVIIGWV